MAEDAAQLAEALATETEAVAHHKREIRLHREALQEAAARKARYEARLRELGVSFHPQAETKSHGQGTAEHPRTDI